MMLINGILCLASAIILLVQIKRSECLGLNPILLKAFWLHFGLLMILAIHHVFSGILDPWVDRFVDVLDPLSDTVTAALGLLISYYLTDKRSKALKTSP